MTVVAEATIPPHKRVLLLSLLKESYHLVWKGNTDTACGCLNKIAPRPILMCLNAWPKGVTLLGGEALWSMCSLGGSEQKIKGLLCASYI